MASNQARQLDFSSLYPSIITAHNLNHTALVRPSDLTELELEAGVSGTQGPKLVKPSDLQKMQIEVPAPKNPKSEPTNYVIRREWEMDRGWANTSDYRAARGEIVVHMLNIWRGSYPKSGSASISPRIAAFLREQGWINVSFSVSDILPKPARVIHTALRVLLDRFWEGHGPNRYETDPGRYLYLSFFPPRHYNCLQRWMWAMKNAHVNLGRANMGPPIEVQAFGAEILTYYHGGPWGLGCDCVMRGGNIYGANSNSLSRHCDHRPIEYTEEYKRLYPVEIINALCRLREDRELAKRLVKNSNYGFVGYAPEFTANDQRNLVNLGAMTVVVTALAVMIAARRNRSHTSKRPRNRKPRNRKPRKPQPYRGRWCP